MLSYTLTRPIFDRPKTPIPGTLTDYDVAAKLLKGFLKYALFFADDKFDKEDTFAILCGKIFTEEKRQLYNKKAAVLIDERCTDFRENFPRNLFNDKIIQTFMNDRINRVYRNYVQSYLGSIYRLIECMAEERRPKGSHENFPDQVLSCRSFFQVLNKTLLDIKRHHKDLDQATLQNFISAINEFDSSLVELFADYCQHEIKVLSSVYDQNARIKRLRSELQEQLAQKQQIQVELQQELAQQQQAQVDLQQQLAEQQQTQADLQQQLVEQQQGKAKAILALEIGAGVVAVCASAGLLFFKGRSGAETSLAEQMSSYISSAFRRG